MARPGAASLQCEQSTLWVRSTYRHLLIFLRNETARTKETNSLKPYPEFRYKIQLTDVDVRVITYVKG
jgi:hypothetical protein